MTTLGDKLEAQATLDLVDYLAKCLKENRDFLPDRWELIKLEKLTRSGLDSQARIEYLEGCVEAYKEDMPILTENLNRNRARIEALEEAIRALLIVMDRGPKPKKLDAALSWRECDELAKGLATKALLGEEV